MDQNHKSLHRKHRQELQPSTRKSRAVQFAEPSTAEDPDASDNDTPENKQRQPNCSRGLSLSLQKQLLVDIEAGGGIQHASLGRIVNSKAESYGSIKSARRKQIENLFYNDWRKLSSIAYLQLLSSHSIAATSQISTFHPNKSATLPLESIVIPPSPPIASTSPVTSRTPVFLSTPVAKMSKHTDVTSRPTPGLEDVHEGTQT